MVFNQNNVELKFVTSGELTDGPSIILLHRLCNSR